MAKVSVPTIPSQSREPADRPSHLPHWQFAAIAKALADPWRYGMVNEIASASDALPCRALKAAETVSVTTIFYHFKSLEAAGLIEVAREGKFALLSPRHLRSLLATAFQRLAPPS